MERTMHLDSPDVASSQPAPEEFPPPPTRPSLHSILSKNPQMQAIFELIDNIAYTNTTVLIEGETGTGKEQTARAIGVTSKGRWPLLPDVPTIEEAGLPGFVSEQRYGLLAPAGTPRPIIERLNTELRNALADETIRKRIVDDGATPRPDSPEDYAAAIEQDRALGRQRAEARAARGGSAGRRAALAKQERRIGGGMHWSRVPGECTEAQPSGTRPGTQREKRGAQYVFPDACGCDWSCRSGSRVSLRSPGTRDHG